MDFRFALYLQTIEVLAHRPQPYQTAVAEIRKRLHTRFGKGVYEHEDYAIQKPRCCS
jgi:hypothetical protein